MNKRIIAGGMIMSSLLLAACGKEEGKAMLEGKTFEATQGGDNEYLLTFNNDGTMQVKENGNLGRTDEASYKVSDKEVRKGYYLVEFKGLDQAAGYVNEDKVWLLGSKDGNPVFRKVYDEGKYNKDGNITKHDYKLAFKEKTSYGDPTDVNDVYLKEK